MRRRTVARREAQAVRREKTIVLAILVQLLVAGFSSVLFVGLVGLYDPGGGQGPTVEVGIAGNATAHILSAAQAESNVEPVTFSSRESALTRFDQARVDALLLGSMNESGVIEIRAVAPEGEFRTTVIVVQLRDILARLERSMRERYANRLSRTPIDMPAPGSGSSLYSLGYTVLLPLLVLLPAFIAGSIMVDSVAEELERNTLELLRVTPLSPSAIFDGKALVAIVSAPLQAVAWLTLLHFNGTTIANPGAILGLVTAYASVAVAVGASLAIVTNTRRDAQLLYSFGTLSLLAVGTVLMPSPVNTIAKLGIGSATATTWLTLLATGGLAMLAIGLARGIVTTTIGSH